MSIFGPPDSRGALEGALLADGSTIPTHNTKWGGRRITNLGDPSHEQDAATKGYVDRKKPIITVWAERFGPTRAGKNQWAFGDGSSKAPNHLSGYPMLAPGRVLRMGLSVSASGFPPLGANVVSVAINGQERLDYFVKQLGGTSHGTTTFTTPLELSIGDEINFISVSADRTVTQAVVNILIELDM